MVDSSNAFSGFSVNDIAAAEAFYGDVLGLTIEQNAMGFLDLTLGSGAKVFIYAKPDHLPATFTILNFAVDDVEREVDQLVASGVSMLRYEGSPQDDKGIMRGHGPDIAWFADPAGNVLSVVKA